MTPAQAIAALDRQLSAHGSTVFLARQNAPEVRARGFVRGYKPDELVGLIQQTDRQLILSPTSLAGFVPRGKDRVSVSGKGGTVEAVDTVEIDDVVVRYNVRVRLAS